MRRMVFLFLLILLSTPVLAQIDLVGPANNHATKLTNVSFEYYVGLDNPTQCNLVIGSQTFPDSTIQEGMNDFVVQGIAEGTYSWHIACQNNTVSQQSSTRQITIDTTAPILQLAKPSTASSQLHVRLHAQDATPVTCQLNKNNVLFDTQTFNGWFEKTYAAAPGNYTLSVMCNDEAGNLANKTKNFMIIGEDYLTLRMNKQSYGLGEQIIMTIDAPQDANVTIDICPNQNGFVECISPLVIPGYPQNITLPLNNQSGSYLVEGIATTPRGVKINQTTYSIENTIGLTLSLSKSPRIAEKAILYAQGTGGIGDMLYTWELSNGTTLITSDDEMPIRPQLPGNYTETVTVRDQADNAKTASISYVVEESLLIDIKVIDAVTRKSLKDANVQLPDGEAHLTNAEGITELWLELGTNKVYAAKEGYRYTYKTFMINENTTLLTLEITPEDTVFSVKIDNPANNATFTTTQFAVEFTTSGATNATCALYLAESNASFLEQQSTQRVTSDAKYSFTLSNLPLGSYNYMVECTQGSIIASTATRLATIAAQEASVSQVVNEDLDAEHQLFSGALEAIKTLGEDEQNLLALLGIDSQLRSAKRSAGQLGKDIFDIKYRQDLSEEEKSAEQERMRKDLANLVKDTPISLEVLDSKTIVDYISEEELDTLFLEHGEALEKEFGKGIIDAKKLILEAQQSYTMKTKVYRARVTYADGREATLSVVSKTLSYGSSDENHGAENERLIEVIPKSVASSAKDITVITKGSHVLIDDPVIAFPTGPSIVYYVEKDLSLSDLTLTRTILMPRIDVKQNGITGYSLFGIIELDSIAKKMGLPLGLLLAIVISAYLAYYFGLIDQAKYLLYEKGPKTQVHYMRVLLNDVHDNLAANNYDKALIIYKEAKLSYEQLSIPAQNEIYAELCSACTQLDNYYLKQLIYNLDAALKQDKLSEAIEWYAKIEGTYERLPENDQNKVAEIVMGLARRLGLKEAVA